MIITIVILSLVLIRSIGINFLNRRMIKHQQKLLEDYKLIAKAQQAHHTNFVSDYYRMYCDHQRSLLQAFLKLSHTHSDEAAKAAATDALLDLARLKEVHLDQLIERDKDV